MMVVVVMMMMLMAMAVMMDDGDDGDDSGDGDDGDACAGGDMVMMDDGDDRDDGDMVMMVLTIMVITVTMGSLVFDKRDLTEDSSSNENAYLSAPPRRRAKGSGGLRLRAHRLFVLVPFCFFILFCERKVPVLT